LSKYERVKVIATRTEQLLNGSPCLLSEKEAAALDHVSDIAEREFVQGLLPMSVARKLESGKVRVYDLKAFMNPMDHVPTPAPAPMTTTRSST
jgi:DNA-directed RNA polymerase subunit K/omega